MGVRSLKAALWTLVLASVACVGHPVEPLDNVVTAVNRQENRLPAKTKLDFLFVVDNSGSMCQEQDNLGRNFDAFSQFLFQELGSAADYRLAVTSTDLQNPEQSGRFLASPAPAMASLNCRDANDDPLIPNTADCPADLPTIIASGRDGNVVDQADLERKFRCLATLGTGGDGFEKGLEAMRLSLSCRGPNADKFGVCCNEDGTYNPACVIGQGVPEPQFLRPDAVLVVVFITDENDCSEPASNPADSRRVICKYGDADGDGDGVPDGYRDPELCNGISPQECFMRECGGLDAATCRSERCVISRLDNSNCEWSRANLTPVDDYRRFLSSLKGDPTSDIVVAAIVGQRAYTTDGNSELTYNPGTPDNPACDPTNAAFDPALEFSEACCPNGACKSQIQTSCESANGEAFAGRRYLELAESFNENGIGCPAGTEPGGPREGEEECVTICTDDFSAPLQAIKDRVAEVLGTYCLDKPPACQVTDEDGARSCNSDEERANPGNYPLRVRQQCVRTIDQGGLCEAVEDRILGPDEYSLVLGEQGCAGGATVKLVAPPPAGSEVFVEFLVAVGAESSPPPVDDTGEGGAAPPMGGQDGAGGEAAGGEAGN
jgi:hypothetical protein